MNTAELTLGGSLHDAPDAKKRGIMQGRPRNAFKAAAAASLCLILGTGFLEATTYYISNAGNDANSGTSTNASWKTVQHVYDVQGNLKAGDSVLLHAGESFDGPLSISTTKQPGTAGNPLTIGRYGTGADPVIYGDHPTATWAAVDGFAGLYKSSVLATVVNVERVFDINGHEYHKVPLGTNDLNAWLGGFTNGSWGVPPSRNVVYVRTRDDGTPPKMHLMEFGVVGVPGYCVVQNVEMCNGGKGIETTGEGTVIRDNYIHDCYATGIMLWNAWGDQVYSNRVERTGYTQIYLQNGGGNWIHHNVCSYTGTDLGNTATIIAGNCVVTNQENCSMGLQQGTNNLIEWNTFSYSRGDFIDWYLEANAEVRYNYGFHSGMATAPCGTGIKVHDNIFDLDSAGSGFSPSHVYDPVNSPMPDSGPVVIYNNVIYDFRGCAFYTAGAGASGVIIRNNIAATSFVSDLPVSGSTTSTGVDSDYNVFYSSGAPMVWHWNQGGSLTTLAAWRAATGQDVHSVYADPQFVLASPASPADFQVKSTSPCIRAGENLRDAGIVPTSTQYQDYLGVPIPQGGGADIGPYQFSSVAPPSSLRVNGPN